MVGPTRHPPHVSPDWETACRPTPAPREVPGLALRSLIIRQHATGSAIKLGCWHRQGWGVCIARAGVLAALAFGGGSEAKCPGYSRVVLDTY